MPFELFEVEPGGTLTRYRSVIRRSALASALRRANRPTVAIDSNDLTVAGTSPHLAASDIVGLGYEEARAVFDPSHQVVVEPPVTASFRPDSPGASLRLAAMAELLGLLMMVGGAFGGMVGTLLALDQTADRPAKTLAFFFVVACASVVVSIGVLLRAAAQLLRHAADG